VKKLSNRLERIYSTQNARLYCFEPHSGTEIAPQAADRAGTFHPKFTVCQA
jgi:hypothetical protein